MYSFRALFVTKPIQLKHPTQTAKEAALKEKEKELF
jgi:hypothetical protein